MVARRSLVAVITAGSLLVAAALGPVALAQPEDVAGPDDVAVPEDVAGSDEVAVPEDVADPEGVAGTDDVSLLTRLDAVEVSLPADPAPTAVTIDEPGTEGARTSGTFDGDVVGGAATVQTLQAELQALYVDADDAGTPVAEAISEVSRGWLDLGQAYDQLTLFEGNDLAFPLDAEDDDGVTTGADALRGRAETGLRLVLGAQRRHLTGYVALRELAPAEPDLQVRLDTRAEQAERFDQELRPRLHRLLSLQTTEVVVPVERFETSAPGVDARARAMTVTCVDRERYLEIAGDLTTDPAAAPDAAPVDPAAAPVDPAVEPVEPVDPAATPVDPAATPVDPAATPVDPATGLDPTAELAAATDPDRADCPGRSEDLATSGG